MNPLQQREISRQGKSLNSESIEGGVKSQCEERESVGPFPVAWHPDHPTSMRPGSCIGHDGRWREGCEKLKTSWMGFGRAQDGQVLNLAEQCSRASMDPKLASEKTCQMRSMTTLRGERVTG